MSHWGVRWEDECSGRGGGEGEEGAELGQEQGDGERFCCCTKNKWGAYKPCMCVAVCQHTHSTLSSRARHHPCAKLAGCMHPSTHTLEPAALIACSSSKACAPCRMEPLAWGAAMGLPLCALAPRAAPGSPPRISMSYAVLIAWYLFLYCCSF